MKLGMLSIHQRLSIFLLHRLSPGLNDKGANRSSHCVVKGTGDDTYSELLSQHFYKFCVLFCNFWKPLFIDD